MINKQKTNINIDKYKFKESNIPVLTGCYDNTMNRNIDQLTKFQTLNFNYLNEDDKIQFFYEFKCIMEHYKLISDFLIQLPDDEVKIFETARLNYQTVFFARKYFMTYYQKFDVRREILRLELNTLGKQLLIKYNSKIEINYSKLIENEIITNARKRFIRSEDYTDKITVAIRKLTEGLRIYSLNRYRLGDNSELLSRTHFPIFYRHIIFITCIRQLGGSFLIPPRLPIYCVSKPSLQNCLNEFNLILIKYGIDDKIILKLSIIDKSIFLRMQKLYFILFFQNYILLQQFNRINIIMRNNVRKMRNLLRSLPAKHLDFRPKWFRTPSKKLQKTIIRYDRNITKRKTRIKYYSTVWNLFKLHDK